jgi:ribonuclease HI
MENEIYKLFTDGGASPNPGRGAAAWLLCDPFGGRTEGARFFPETTNNRMELQAVIDGLAHIRAGARVALYVDSQYVQKGMTEWIQKWKKNSWRTSNKTDVLNRDLWERLDALSSAYHITWHWVRGHSGHAENERCDALVQEARRLRRDI